MSFENVPPFIGQIDEINKKTISAPQKYVNKMSVTGFYSQNKNAGSVYKESYKNKTKGWTLVQNAAEVISI